MNLYRHVVSQISVEEVIGFWKVRKTYDVLIGTSRRVLALMCLSFIKRGSLQMLRSYSSFFNESWYSIRFYMVVIVKAVAMSCWVPMETWRQILRSWDNVLVVSLIPCSIKSATCFIKCGRLSARRGDVPRSSCFCLAANNVINHIVWNLYLGCFSWSEFNVFIEIVSHFYFYFGSVCQKNLKKRVFEGTVCSFV